MKNTLSKIPFYKGKSVMITEASIGVNYGEANPFIQMKFAPREDYKSQGQWDDANCYWITTYIDLFNFVNGINAVAQGKMEKYEMSNPKKGVMVQVRSSTNTESNTTYITFYFFRGKDVKIKAALVHGTEFLPYFSYFKNLLDNYNNVCATALLRNDIYYDLFVKGKDKNNSSGNGGHSNNNNGYSNNNNNNNNGYSNNKPKSNDKFKDTNTQSTNNTSNVNSIEDDIAGMESGMSFNDDVPF